MNRRSFLKTAASSTSLLLAAPSVNLAADARPPSEGDLLSEARERLLRYRRSRGVVAVRNAAGQPVPGITVRVEQLRHGFLFGCNCFRLARVREADREDQYRQRFAEVFNYATVPFYWSSYEPQRGQPGYDYSDRVADWCRSRRITCKGHPLVWDHPAGTPRWLPEDHAEIEALSNARVREIVSRFKGRIDFWDVVNEATHLPDHANKTRMAGWGAALGAKRYTIEPLRLARAANPQATLLVNDYRVDPPYARLLESLVSDGKPPFDAVGIQSHMHDGGWPLARVWEVCDTYAEFGVPIHFTETTLVSGPRRGPGENWHPTDAESEARQADYVAKFYTMLFAHPALQAVTWWDFSDDGAWQGAAAGWLRRDMSPKPVYERMQELIREQWWTRTQGSTDARGEFSAAAFHGTHRVTVQMPGGRELQREVVWQPGSANRVEIAVAAT